MVRLIEGLELLGKVENTGYKNNSYLIRTPDNQFIELTELLYRVIEAIKSEDNEYDAATVVSQKYEKQIDARAVRFLIDTRLRPLGIIKNLDDKNVSLNSQANSRSDNLLGLKFRMTLLSEKITTKIAKFFSPLFSTLIMIGVFLDFVLLNIWLYGYHGVLGSLQETFNQPFTFLLVIALLLSSTLFHEFGHAAGCSYGGAKPGRIGAGLYFIWPAFFTDITDIYRVKRSAKLKSDIGGIYFNSIFAILLAGAYFLTSFEPLLLVITLQNFSIINQLLPFNRLDGYYIVSDIVGLSDLSGRIKPVLRNVFLRKNNPAVNNLKLWVKLVITFWVALTVPAILLLILFMLLNSPRIFYMAWVSASTQMTVMMNTYASGEYILFSIQILQFIILSLPLLSIGFLFYSIAKQIIALNNHLQYKDTTNQQIPTTALSR